MPEGGNKMSGEFTNEPMMEMFLFETTQLIEQLEQLIITAEKESSFSMDTINEIFRIMHTIKGSSAMMMFQNISSLAHSMEDVFYFLREEKPENINCSRLSDLVLGGIDFIKEEVEKIRNGVTSDGDASELIKSLKEFLLMLKQEHITQETDKVLPETSKNQQYYISQNKKTPMSYDYSYKAVIYFDDGCEMENIRAYTIIHNLKDVSEEVYYIPKDIIDNDDSIEVIRNQGFQIFLKANLTYEKMYSFFNQTIFLKDLELTQLEDDSEFEPFHSDKKKIDLVLDNPVKVPSPVTKETSATVTTSQNIISVSVAKLDKLMDLVGEMVIAEAMVIQNPDLRGLELDNFQKAARQLSKITNEMQDMVMSIRMVPLSTTFHKMHRVVRDMSKKLQKEVVLDIYGEETEVDKNIIEHISDPLMHIVRNAIDHGLETIEERKEKGKPLIGTVVIEAKNSGSDVLIVIKDDGKGLDKEKILKKARENKLIYGNEEEMSDKEIYQLILLPGFSTKDKVTEFSGRGVGMDVVVKNIEMVGGSLSVESIKDKGSSIILKIPLTLAIIDGMNVKVGKSFYTIPTISIKESFRPKEGNLITDPDGNEMIMVRGQCYPILRLHEIYQVKTGITSFSEGIFIMVEQDEKTICLFADELVGQQQVVVKALPKYIQNFKRIRGLAGCTLLGDGSISLILDVNGLIQRK